MNSNLPDFIYSDDIDEVLSQVPHWLVRWGSLAILMLLFCMVLALWIIQYPEALNGRILISSPTPPVNLVSRVAGKLRLLVKDGDLVDQNESLAYIDNPAKLKSIDELKFELNWLTETALNNQTAEAYHPGNIHGLGELQGPYIQLSKHYSEYDKFVESSYIQDKLMVVLGKIESFKELNETIKNGISEREKELENVKSILAAKKKVFAKGLITKSSLDETESQFFGIKRLISQDKSAIIQNEIEIASLNDKILDIQEEINKTKKDLLQNLKDAILTMKVRIDEWEYRYLLVSPIKGRISLFKFWSNLQNVNVNDEILTIIPEQDKYLGKIYLSAMGAGKIKDMQRVRIELDDYPAVEFGVLEGRVSHTSAIVRNSQYAVNISLPPVLETSYGKIITPNSDIEGNARIIVSNRRLLEIIFYHFRHIYSDAIR